MTTAKTARLVLVIDDDALFCLAVEKFFARGGIQVMAAHTCRDGLASFMENRIEVVLLDQNLPDGKGLNLCAPLLEARDRTKIIFITANPSFEHAVKAMRNGAHDYLSKPMELEELELAVQKAFRAVELERLAQVKKFNDRIQSSLNRPIGIDGGLRPIKQLIDLAASSRVPVLITGETGTGKNVVAKTIHYIQEEPNCSFISSNCATLPEQLIESELFGHEKGAFTGAAAKRKGLFEMADGGTLFLDEIGEIPLHLQAKLLGVLDDGTVKRLGGDTPRQVDVRILAATNVNLEEAIAKKQFREDLFYRLSVLRIHLPPLRDRKEDIPALCHHFMRNRLPDQQLVIPENDLQLLQEYAWPGNIRELKNIIERAIILRAGATVRPAAFLGTSPSAGIVGTEPEPPSDKESLVEPLAKIEKRQLRKALAQFDQNHTRAARALGIARSTLIRKLKQYRLKSGDSF